MSTQKPSTKCPKCGADTPVELTTLIEPQSPALEELLSGKLNCISCVECNNEFFCESPLIFRDMEEGVLVFYDPNVADMPWLEAEDYMRRAMEPMLEEMDDDLRPDVRLCRSRNDFVEKITLFEKGYDDRLMEYLKYHIYCTEKAYEPEKHLFLFDFSRSDEESIFFTVFDRRGGEAKTSLELTRGHYDKLGELFEDGSTGLDIDKVFPPYYVQVEVLLTQGG